MSAPRVERHTPIAAASGGADAGADAAVRRLSFSSLAAAPLSFSPEAEHANLVAASAAVLLSKADGGSKAGLRYAFHADKNIFLCERASACN